MRNEVVLHRGKRDRNVLRKIKKGRLNTLVKFCLGIAV